MDTSFGTLVFVIIIIYITINAVLFQIVDNNTRYEKEYNNKIFLIILSSAIFLIFYNRPLKYYREKLYLKNSLERYKWLKSELIYYNNSKFGNEYDNKIKYYKRRLKLLNIYGKKFSQKSSHMG